MKTLLTAAGLFAGYKLFIEEKSPQQQQQQQVAPPPPPPPPNQGLGLLNNLIGLATVIASNASYGGSGQTTVGASGVS